MNPHQAITITCNSALFIEKNLEHHYKHFDRIIVVDGPSLPGVRETTGNGERLTGGKPHSTDGTVDLVRSFQRSHPNVVLITNKRSWPGKASKFNAALKHLQPGYVWQIDCDEFWMDEDIKKLKQFTEKSPGFTDFEFYSLNRWGDAHHITKMDPKAWGNSTIWRRVFKFHPGDAWKTHEPPRMQRSVPERVLRRTETLKMGIFLHHYGYCVRSQFEQREKFYGLKPGELTGPLDQWRENKPLASVAGELVPYRGRNPIDIDFLHES